MCEQCSGFLTSGAMTLRSSFTREEDVVDETMEAQALASLSEAELRKVVEKSHAAAASALSAAQVAIWTEAVAALGTFAALLTAWVGWKMDDSELPPDLQIPRRDPELPAELLRAPPSGGSSPAMAART